MEVFNRMVQENVQPNEVTYLSILKACASPSALKRGKELHTYIRDGGLESDVRVGTALLKLYAKCGCMKEARRAFEELTNRNIVPWNVMIGAYTESGCGEGAYRLYLQMKQKGVKPDVVTCVSILNACASAGPLEWVKEDQSHVLDSGFASDLRVGTALVHMYADSGSIDDARAVINRMEERDVITWNIMIGGIAQHGHGRGAYELFLRMRGEGCIPNAITYMSILNAYASAETLEWVKDVHHHALEAGYESDLRVGNALIHMYSKSGRIDEARMVFDGMDELDVITRNIMIGGRAQHGCGLEALEMFKKMNASGVKPDGA